MPNHGVARKANMVHAAVPEKRQPRGAECRQDVSSSGVTILSLAVRFSSVG